MKELVDILKAVASKPLGNLETELLKNVVSKEQEICIAIKDANMRVDGMTEESSYASAKVEARNISLSQLYSQIYSICSKNRYGTNLSSTITNAISECNKMKEDGCFIELDLYRIERSSGLATSNKQGIFYIKGQYAAVFQLRDSRIESRNARSFVLQYGKGRRKMIGKSSKTKKTNIRPAKEAGIDIEKSSSTFSCVRNIDSFIRNTPSMASSLWFSATRYPVEITRDKNEFERDETGGDRTTIVFNNTKLEEDSIDAQNSREKAKDPIDLVMKEADYEKENTIGLQADEEGDAFVQERDDFALQSKKKKQSTSRRRKKATEDDDLFQ